jgi:hypothetical protein
MKKPQRLGRHLAAASGTCVTMGDRVRHTARLQCRDLRGTATSSYKDGEDDLLR